MAPALPNFDDHPLDYLTSLWSSLLDQLSSFWESILDFFNSHSPPTHDPSSPVHRITKTITTTINHHPITQTTTDYFHRPTATATATVTTTAFSGIPHVPPVDDPLAWVELGLWILIVLTVVSVVFSVGMLILGITFRAIGWAFRCICCCGSRRRDGRRRRAQVVILGREEERLFASTRGRGYGTCGRLEGQVQRVEGRAPNTGIMRAQTAPPVGRAQRPLVEEQENDDPPPAYDNACAFVV